MNICLWSFTNQNGVKVWQVRANGQPLSSETPSEGAAWLMVMEIANTFPRYTFSKWDDITQTESKRLPIRDAIAQEGA